MEILAIIPARSGSKGIPHKNIFKLAGKPLLAYSITHALASSLVTRTLVSTDSHHYATIAREYGAEVPFIRPIEYSQDQSTDLVVFQHALNWLAENENYRPEICVHLRPTHPIRDPKHIDAMIQIMLNDSEIDSVRSVVPSPETPYKMWFYNTNGTLSPVVSTTIKDAYNMPRQVLPQTYLQNACIDVVRSRVVTEMQSMSGNYIAGFIMNENHDIDTLEQFEQVEKLMINQQSIQNVQLLSNPKTFCFDIDGIIATLVPVSNYNTAKPQSDVIRIVNYLYDMGHQIVLFTARGSATGLDWQLVTEKQMLEWGVKYHQLLFGKPAADYYVDDKLITIDQLKESIDNS
jgi:CMP-N,N'-diacetyllegionaminic acid synthase